MRARDLPDTDRPRARDAADDAIFSVPAFCDVSGCDLLEALHRGQKRHQLREVWSPDFRLPSKLIEYLCAVTAELPPVVRQEAVLALKRYVWAKASRSARPAVQNLQVVALTCANLAMKHWLQDGLPEKQLHNLSCFAFTRRDFVDAEVDVMQALDCTLYWEGALLAEWMSLLLFLAAPLLSAGVEDTRAIDGVAAHISDVLLFEDELMAAHPPSELAGAAVHAAVVLCTKNFQRSTFTQRVGQLCRAKEDEVARLSERILGVALGARHAELIFAGSGMTAEDSDVGHTQNTATPGFRRSRTPTRRGGGGGEPPLKALKSRDARAHRR